MSHKVDLRTNFSTAIPTRNGGTGSAGSEPASAHGDHQHPGTPTPALTRRYYLTWQSSDLPRDYGGTEFGYLLSTSNPSDEAHAENVGHPGTSPLYLWFDTPSGEPGLTAWPAGVVTGNLRVRVLNAHVGLTYHLYPGDESIVYGSMLSDVTDGIKYQDAPYPSAPSLTSSYQTLQISLYVRGLTGASNRRMRADVILQVTGGSLTDEVFQVRCGGDDASYFDTLFPVGTGGVTQHNDLLGRGFSPDYTQECHPQASIVPVLAPPTSLVAGMLTPAPGSDTVLLEDPGTVINGIRRPYNSDCGKLRLFFLYSGTVHDSASGDPDFPACDLGNFGGLSGGEASGIDFGGNGIINLFYCGGVWNLDGAPNQGRT